MAAEPAHPHPHRMRFEEAIALAARLMEGAGVLTIVVGTVVALGVALARGRGRDGVVIFRSFRQLTGRAILLGLELLVAADIIRTVAESPTMDKVLVLGVIVLIRTFLSFTLEVELEGRWPWQTNRGSDARKSR